MDSYRLWYASQMVDLGPWLLADPGPDFDVAALMQAQYAHNPFAEGGVLVYEDSPIRRFKFPLRIASTGSYGGLEGLEQTLRAFAKPGAVIDLQPETVPTADALRFDVADGRIDPHYSIFQQRIARREATLELDVQPFGYLPTWILLASGASMGIPGSISLGGVQIIGDAPAQVRIGVLPQVAATQYGAGTWLPDMLAWSLSVNGSFNTFIAAASLSAMPTSLASGVRNATVIGAPLAVGSQGLRVEFAATIGASGGASGWAPLVQYQIPAALEPAYRGRSQLFAYVRYSSPSAPASSPPLQMMGDVAPDNLALVAPLATFNSPIATVPYLGSTLASLGMGSAFTLVNLGVVSLPGQASGYGQVPAIRLWAKPATSNVGLQPQLTVGGLYLLSLDAGAGILPRGVVQPSLGAPSPLITQTLIDSSNDSVILGVPTGDVGTSAPAADARAWYRGDLPRFGASAGRVDVLLGQRASGATGLMAVTSPMSAAYSVYYRPRFTFLGSI